MNRKKQFIKNNKPQMRKRSNVDGVYSSPNTLVKIPKTVDFLFPDRQLIRLTYNGFGLLTITTPNTYASKRYRPSGVYDVDPLLASTTVIGFNELAAIYANYRVVASKLNVKVSCSTDQPATLVALPLNADPGGSPSLAVVNSWYNNAYSKTDLIGAKGSPKAVVSCEMSSNKIFGSMMTAFDRDFQSAVGTVPVNNWYWAIGIVSGVAPPVTASYFLQETMTIDVEFFTRNRLDN